jgi:hypothetical protein
MRYHHAMSCHAMIFHLCWGSDRVTGWLSPFMHIHSIPMRAVLICRFHFMPVPIPIPMPSCLCKPRPLAQSILNTISKRSWYAYSNRPILLMVRKQLTRTRPPLTVWPAGSARPPNRRCNKSTENRSVVPIINPTAPNSCDPSPHRSGNRAYRP